MRNLSNLELDRIKLLTENSVELALIEPTAIGLGKSIMDATASVSTYLKEQRLHDYKIQNQGPNNKVQIDACLILEEKLMPSVASLYRPHTKNGDHRIWFKGLGSYAKASDILGLIVFNKKIFVINITSIDISKLLDDKNSNPLLEIVEEIKQVSNFIAAELLLLLKKIAALGPVPALLNADTGIGRTLETLLKININSSKKPDYKGIELKSFRDKKGNRKTLFAQVPDWSISKFKSSSEILNNFGYQRGADVKLYCTVSTIVTNSQSLKLKIDNNAGRLIETATKNNIGDFVVWTLENLHARLLEKHNETFWIAADSILKEGNEYFQFKEVLHTRKPILTQFDILLEQGIITLDHLIKKDFSGKVAERGPLFKIKPKLVNLLFPPSKLYSLT